MTKPDITVVSDLESRQGDGDPFDAAPDLLLEVDAQGRIWRALGSGRGWFAPPLGKDSSHGSPAIQDLLPEHPARAFLDAVGQASEDRRSSLVVSPWALATGPQWVELAVALVPGTGADSRFVAVVRDVSERRAAERERAVLERGMRHDEKMRSLARLAGGVSNDMNNILGAVMGFASSLRADVDSSTPSSEDVDRIIEACWKGYDLANDLGNLSSERHLEKRRVSLNDAVREVSDLLERAVPAGIVLRTELHRGDPSTWGDPAQITQILVNLALNGIDAMHAGGILTICTEEHQLSVGDAEQYPDLKPGRYAVLEIADTGDGMDRATAEHAFEPFYTTKIRGKASGLGLPMVYGIITSYGGTIILDSKAGEGTTVRVYLPATRSGADLGPESVRSAVDAGRANLALVVDDEELLLALGHRLLERLGFDVLTAPTGDDALRLYQERGAEISVVLLDLIMPVMDGAEIFTRLRQLDPEARVIITSGYSKEKMVGELMAQGAAGFLRKPFDLEKLAAVVGVPVPADDD